MYLNLQSGTKTSGWSPSSGSHPRCVIGTGAITDGKYSNKLAGRKAELSHYVAATLIVVKSGNLFIPRNLVALQDGACVNEGVLYKANGSKRKLDHSEMTHVWGDIHAVEVNPTYLITLKNIQKAVPCGDVVLHDLHTQVNSHHVASKVITRAKLAQTGLLNIEHELNETRKLVEEVASIFNSVKVVESNHNRHLSQYLDRGHIESENFKTASILGLAMYHGIDPLQFSAQHYEAFTAFLEGFMSSIKNRTELNFKISTKTKCDNVTYLEAGEKLKVRNFDLGWHGDASGNGSKGTPDSLKFQLASESAKSHGTVTGHTHTPGYINNAFVVGTTTYLPYQENAPAYCRGSISSWANASVIVYSPKGYSNSTAQLFIALENGKVWR